MAQPTDITQILAALGRQEKAKNICLAVEQLVDSIRTAATQPQATPPSHTPQAGQPAAPPMTFPPMPAGAPQAPIPGYPLPQPTNSGNLDLSSIKPVSSGNVNVSFEEALSRAKSSGYAAERGVSYDGGHRDDPRMNGRGYRRSRSRSPPRRDSYGDNYNPYRDDRRDPRRNFSRRSRSPSPIRDRHGGFSPPRNYTRDRSPPPGDASETITVESNVVGLVIGRAGENLRRVGQDTDTRIQFITGPDTTGPRRECRITGTPRAREHAKSEINRIIEANRQAQGAQQPSREYRGNAVQSKPAHQPVLREGENSTQIMVPDKTAGLIIGRGGETIRDLQERSGCHINIVGANKSVNGLRPVNLIGSNAAAAHAKELILEIVESDTRSTGQGAANNARPPPDVYNDPYASSNKSSETIRVPSEAVGMIIGKGGETIKEMQNTTGCKINVSQNNERDGRREIGLIGSRQAIDAAKRNIYDKVDQVRAKNAANQAGAGGRNDHYDGSGYSQPQQQYGQQQYGQPQQGMMTGAQQRTATAAAGQTDPNADPYAPYGGYQNYLMLWQLAQAQQGQGAPPAGAGQ